MFFGLAISSLLLLRALSPLAEVSPPMRCNAQQWVCSAARQRNSEGSRRRKKKEREAKEEKKWKKGERRKGAVEGLEGSPPGRWSGFLASLHRIVTEKAGGPNRPRATMIDRAGFRLANGNMCFRFCFFFLPSLFSFLPVLSLMLPLCLPAHSMCIRDASYILCSAPLKSMAKRALRYTRVFF